jgi:hypothetical protein
MRFKLNFPLFPSVVLPACFAAISVLLVACAPPKVAEPVVAPPKVPWRVVACAGESNAQVRIASRIPAPDLTAHCASEWKSGFLRVSVRFDGAFDEQLLVRATWFDGGDKIIPLDNTFDRQFSLGSAATRTESWRSPIPKGQRVRLDVSCVRC